MKETQPWLVLYEEKIRNRDSDMREFRQLNGRSMPYRDHLKENMPMICPNSWMDDQTIEKYGVFYCHPRDEEDALNTWIVCINFVIISLSKLFNL